MPTDARYVAECLWPNVTRTDVDALVRRLSFNDQDGVDYVGATLVPGDDVVFVWFAAEAESDVRAVCLRASIPFDRVIGVEDWPAPQAPRSHPKERP
jgi:hypothetical protein